MNDSLNLGQFIALLIPLILVQIGLWVFALRDLVKRKRVKWDNKWLWGAIILLVNYVGPILYFILGREED